VPPALSPPVPTGAPSPRRTIHHALRLSPRQRRLPSAVLPGRFAPGPGSTASGPLPHPSRPDDRTLAWQRLHAGRHWSVRASLSSTCVQHRAVRVSAGHRGRVQRGKHLLIRHRDHRLGCRVLSVNPFPHASRSRRSCVGCWCWGHRGSQSSTAVDGPETRAGRVRDGGASRAHRRAYSLDHRCPRTRWMTWT